MNRLLLIALLLASSIALVACDPQATAQAPEPPVAAPDNSEAEQLLGIAEQHRALAETNRALVDHACRKDPDVLHQVVRDADAANRVWRGVKATDYVKLQRNDCLNALNDVRGMALNCAAPEFNTHAAAADQRHYAADISSCEALIRTPLPLELMPPA